MTLHKVEGTLPHSPANTAVRAAARAAGEGNLSPARERTGAVGGGKHLKALRLPREPSPPPVPPLLARPEVCPVTLGPTRGLRARRLLSPLTASG